MIVIDAAYVRDNDSNLSWIIMIVMCSTNNEELRTYDDVTIGWWNKDVKMNWIWCPYGYYDD